MTAYISPNQKICYNPPALRKVGGVWLYAGTFCVAGNNEHSQCRCYRRLFFIELNFVQGKRSF
ncbi:hypothetical protein DLK00_02305 [Haemophilus influenzae]|nr:hypothetical protein DLK00_02305 [Haemophilus influenzae]TWU99409.1 hypothetical protein FRB18_06505 [Haemophilus influenzae]